MVGWTRAHNPSLTQGESVQWGQSWVQWHQWSPKINLLEVAPVTPNPPFAHFYHTSTPHPPLLFALDHLSQQVENKSTHSSRSSRCRSIICKLHTHNLSDLCSEMVKITVYICLYWPRVKISDRAVFPLSSCHLFNCLNQEKKCRWVDCPPCFEEKII